MSQFKSENSGEAAPVGMSLRTWWDEVGTANALNVAEAAACTESYFRVLKYSLKRPGYDLALRIIEAAHRLTPGFVPDLAVLMLPVAVASAKADKSLPSAAFMKAQAARAAQGVQA